MCLTTRLYVLAMVFVFALLATGSALTFVVQK